MNGTDRVTITWSDGAVRDTWLRVTIPAGGAVGLANEDVFYFGNLVGETGGRSADTLVGAVDVMDVAAVRRNVTNSAATAMNRCDLNRDGIVDSFDVGIARANSGHVLGAVTLGDVPAFGTGVPAVTFSESPIRQRRPAPTRSARTSPRAGRLNSSWL